MTETIELSAPDGHPFTAYRADPTGTPRGGVVLRATAGAAIVATATVRSAVRRIRTRS